MSAAALAADDTASRAIAGVMNEVVKPGEPGCTVGVLQDGAADVAHVLGMSVSAASHHLRKLRDLKILKYRNDRKMAYYSLRDRFAAELVQHALRQALP